MRWEQEEAEDHRAKLLANRDFAELIEVVRHAV
jgi:hypothetical protein